MKYIQMIILLSMTWMSSGAQALQSLDDGFAKAKQILMFVSQPYAPPGFLRCHEQSASKDPDFVYDQSFDCELNIDEVPIIHNINFKLRKETVVESNFKIDLKSDTIQMARFNSEKLLDSKNVEVFRASASGNDTFKVSWFEIGLRKYEIYFFPRHALVTARLSK